MAKEQGALCDRCEKRVGTEIWHEGGMDYARGYYTLRCLQCVLEKCKLTRRGNCALELPAEPERRLADVLARVPGRIIRDAADPDSAGTALPMTGTASPQPTTPQTCRARSVPWQDDFRTEPQKTLARRAVSRWRGSAHRWPLDRSRFVFECTTPRSVWERTIQWRCGVKETPRDGGACGYG